MQDQQNDDDSDDNPLQEEAVLPETDRVNLGCPREFGYTKIYQVEQDLNGNAGTKMAIPKVSFYLKRGKGLQHLNIIEYECLIQMEKKRSKKMTVLRSQAGNPLRGSNIIPTLKCNDSSSNNWLPNNPYHLLLVMHHRNVLETDPCN
jgi:hypothetical protein